MTTLTETINRKIERASTTSRLEGMTYMRLADYEQTLRALRTAVAALERVHCLCQTSRIRQRYCDRCDSLTEIQKLIGGAE